MNLKIIIFIRTNNFLNNKNYLGLKYIVDLLTMPVNFHLLKINHNTIYKLYSYVTHTSMLINKSSKSECTIIN